MRLFSQSAQTLKHQYLTLKQTNSKKLNKAEDEIMTSWNELQDSLQNSASLLLTRFRSDEIQFESVLELLDCLEITSIEGKELKGLSKSFTELFETIQSETILSKMGKVLRFWMIKESNQQKIIINSLKQLIENCWTKVLELIESIPLLENNNNNNNRETEDKKDKRKKGKNQNQKKDKKVKVS